MRHTITHTLGDGRVVIASARVVFHNTPQQTTTPTGLPAFAYRMMPVFLERDYALDGNALAATDVASALDPLALHAIDEALARAAQLAG